ncbi:MAG: glycosyltransferase [Deltaproteobacteria bacterium]|nr:glycosyltransferase [Deltaproteobacteria bacterium]MBW1793897.1 glycosyltransferase [Deltaproteobacteria bacterium]MBW2329862.1 glycosyltransferase [Deltaproteobacteria bacterium]
MPDPKVTVLIPNYKTLLLTKLCLRLLRKHTDLQKVHVIVIDNDSQDESLDYLRSLKWIELIERKKALDDTPSLSHSRALDLALERVTTPYVFSIHTDTLFKDPRWLDVLLTEIEKEPVVAGVGSWKLEKKPSFMKRLGKAIEYQRRIGYCRLIGKTDKAKDIENQRQSGYYRLIGKTDITSEGKGKDYYYLRSHCALYRMDLIEKMNLRFSDGAETAGKVMHKKLVDKGYKMVFLPSEFLGRYVVHLNHATAVLHPELGSRKKTIRKGLKRFKKELEALNAGQILKDNSLDY